MIKIGITLIAFLFGYSTTDLFNTTVALSESNSNIHLPIFSANTSQTTESSKSDSSSVKEEIKISSFVGEVIFPHMLHFEDLEIECVDCHHQIKARELNIPHMEYFDEFWIDCNICHNRSENPGKEMYACVKCHNNEHTNIADETLNAKVVVHKKCWECHETGMGVSASESCAFCHSGPKTR